MEAANTLMDVVILVLLVAAIAMGAALMMQITKLRRERFRFDQMTQALNGQLAIFQAALESGKLDMETKITRMNTAIERAQKLSDELHVLADGRAQAPLQQQAPKKETERPAVMRRTPPQPSVFVPEPEEAREERPMFSIIDPEFMIGVKEDDKPAIEGFDDLSPSDREELSQLATPAEKHLMAALKRAGKR